MESVKWRPTHSLSTPREGCTVTRSDLAQCLKNDFKELAGAHAHARYLYEFVFRVTSKQKIGGAV